MHSVAATLVEVPILQNFRSNTSDTTVNDLKDYYKPEWDLTKGGYELVKFFEKIGFTEKQFKSRDTIRLKQLQYLTETNKINSELRKIK